MTDLYFKGELPRNLLKSVLIQNQQCIPSFIGGRIKIHVSFKIMSLRAGKKKDAVLVLNLYLLA